MAKLGKVVLTAWLLMSAPVRAADDNVCYGLKELMASVKDCQQNSFFSRAADACLAKLNRDISTQQALLAAAMTANNAGTASAQSARMANNSQNLAQSQLTLDSLEAEAKRARAEIVDYSENFSYAGPVSHSFAERYHMVGFLQKFPCYADNNAILADDVKRIDKQLGDLAKARQTAAQLATATRANQKTLDASSVTSSAHGRSTASVPAPAPSGASPQNASTITGTEKIQTEKNAADEILSSYKP